MAMLSRPTRRSARSSACTTAARVRRKPRGAAKGISPSITSIRPTALRNGTSIENSSPNPGHKKRAPFSGPPVVRLYRVVGPAAGPDGEVSNRQCFRLEALAAAEALVLAARQLHFQQVTALLVAFLALHGTQVEERGPGPGVGWRQADPGMQGVALQARGDLLLEELEAGAADGGDPDAARVAVRPAFHAGFMAGGVDLVEHLDLRDLVRAHLVQDLVHGLDVLLPLRVAGVHH